MSTINDKATVELFVNGEQAEKMMTRLRQRADDLQTAIDKAIQAGDKKREKKLQRELAVVQKELNRSESAAKGAKRVLDNLDNTSLHGLRNALKFLKKELAATKPNTDEWAQYAEQIERVQGRITELTGAMGEAQQSLWGKITDGAANIWPVWDLAKQGYDYAQQLVESYTGIEAEMANTRKYTGMSADEVERLNAEFKKMDTRTSREELNLLAQEAGRLGKQSVDDVMGFVRAADIINVALDDLGEGATLTLSKLTGIFGDEAKYGTEAALLKVGSVINDLSQNCSASAPYIANFASRLGGVGAQAGMTVQQIMAYASVLDANNQQLESSATALSQTIVRLYQEPEKYAKVAGLDAKKFAKLMREDANEAVLTLLDTLSKAGGMQNLAPMFKDMGESGSGAIAALSVLAGNIDMVRAQQEAANKSFDEGTSVINESNVANATAEARLAKLYKTIEELKIELGSRALPVVEAIISAGAKGADVATSLIGIISRNKQAVATLAAAIIGYTVATKTATALTKLQAAAQVIQTTVSKAQAAITTTLTATTGVLKIAYFKLTGQTVAATAAQRAMSAAMSATPWGAILTAVGAAIAAFAIFKDKTEDITESADTMTAAQGEANAKLAEEKVLLEQNITKVKNFNGTKGEEATLIAQLNDKYGPILGTYKSLKEWQDALTTSGQNYCNTLYAQMMLEAKHQQALDLIKKANDARDNGLKGVGITNGDNINEFVSNLKYILSGDALSWDEAKWNVYTDNKQAWDRIADGYDAQAQAIIAEWAEGVENLSKQMAAKTPPPAPEPAPNPYQSQTLADKERRKREAEQRKEQTAAVKAYQQSMRDIKAEYDKETAENVLAYGSGERSYSDYIARKEQIDLDYIKRRVKAYETMLEGESAENRTLLKTKNAEYQADLLKIAEMQQKQSDATKKRSADDLEHLYKLKVAATEVLFADPTSEYYGDEAAQEEELFRLKIGHLKDLQALYNTNTDKWAEYQERIDEEEQNNKVSRAKRLQQTYERYADEYSQLTAERRYNMELKLVKELFANQKISAEDYEIFCAKLREKYRGEAFAAEKAASDSRAQISVFGGTIDARSAQSTAANRSSNIAAERLEAESELTARLEAGMISQEEYAEGIRKIGNAYRKEIFDPVREGLDEQTRMLLDLGLAWADMFANISDTGKLSFEDIGAVAQASFAVMTAGLQTYAQFMDAQKREEIALATKRYDKEAEAAQGSSYKLAQIEKNKEKELNRIKAEYARKEFAVKVIMAVAQTAQNALLGYAAGLQAGFPMATWMAPMLAGMAVAQGAVQIALLRKQQAAAAAEGYSKGGFTRAGRVDEPAGIVHAGEWVASQKLLANPVARPLIEALDAAQRNNTIGSLRAADVSRAITANQSVARIAETPTSDAATLATIASVNKAVERLNKRLNEPFVTVNTVTGDHGIQQALRDHENLLKNITPKSKWT